MAVTRPEILRLLRRAEALEEGLDLEVEQVARKVWVCPSKSDPGEMHILCVMADGTIVCDCFGARAGQPCRHVEAVAVRIELAAERKAEREAAQPRHSSYPPLKRVALT